MNKKSKRKNDLRSSIILLLILLLLLISSTYAWFTANRTVTISQFDVNIEASNGLQISANATEWKAILSNADLASDAETAYEGNTNQIPTSMVPVSTAGATNANGELIIYHGNVSANDKGVYALTSSLEQDKAGTSGKYIAFDMFLKVDVDTDLELTNASSVVMNGNDKGIKQASRVAFVVEGWAEAGAEASTITAKKGGTTAPVYIWEPNANWHTAAAVNHAKNTYGIDTTQSVNGTSVTAVEYYGIKDLIEEPITLDKTHGAAADSKYFSKVTPAYVTESDADGVMKVAEGTTGIDIFSISAGITKVRVYMWVEGQDVDCEDMASGTGISYNLQFQVAE
ncbi:MAG: hypothetical protein IJE68_00345 [Clostridia bacterium]|nr:hypothetical protein [Clostridia bacterium]